jgi:hypothetical protein
MQGAKEKLVKSAVAFCASDNRKRPVLLAVRQPLDAAAYEVDDRKMLKHERRGSAGLCIVGLDQQNGVAARILTHRAGRESGHRLCAKSPQAYVRGWSRQGIEEPNQVGE